MENKPAKEFTTETLTMLERLLAPEKTSPKRDQTKNEKTLGSAMMYEKFRVALEYQEEHLVFKNAVSRILRRKLTLAPGITSSKLLADLLIELSWANYLNPESLGSEEKEKLNQALERYLLLLDCARSSLIPRRELQKMMISWLACEIDEIMKPNKLIEPLLDYTYSVLSPALQFEKARISEEDNEIQLKIAIFSLIFKPDLSLLQFWTIERLYPGWNTWDKAEVKKFGRSFDPYYNKAARILNHPLKKRYMQFAKRNIAPFVLMKKLLAKGNLSFEHLRPDPLLFKELVLHTYDDEIKEVKQKVWRGTIRALIFILLTKISLAFIIEVPADRFLTGSINYVSLLINICLPPLLMLVAGTFVKSPSRENRATVAEATSGIILSNKINDKVFSLERKNKAQGSRICSTCSTPSSQS